MNYSLISRKFALFLGLGAIILGLGEVTLAQSTNPNKESGYQSNEQNASTGSTFGNSFNPFDLIHNANFRRSRNSEDFNEDTQQNLNNAAEEFKRLQREKLQQQTNPASNSSPGHSGN